MNPHDLSLSLAEALVRAQSKAESHSGAAPAPAHRLPSTIAISREAGALGTQVAREVGRRLGWPVYDQELLDKIAEAMKRPAAQLRALDERNENWLEESLSTILNETRISPTAYMKYLVGVVRGLGLKGPCVLVGRGSNWILPRDWTVRVRLVAPAAFRARVAVDRLGVAEADAARWVETTEAARAEFIKRNFHVDPADPHQYHLVLNAAELTVAECAETILHTLHQLQRRAGGRDAGPAAAQAP